MQRVCLALLFALTIPALAACDGGGGCLVDSDCADFTQVCLAQRCVAAGTLPDAGGRDSGPEPDAGEEDAGSDSGTPVADGGPDASMEDAATPPCADVTGGWTVAFVTSCGSAMSGYGVTIAAGAATCEFAAASNDVTAAPAIDGTFTLAADNNLTGMLNPGAAGAVDCTGSLSGSTLTFVCGGCVMNLNRI